MAAAYNPGVRHRPKMCPGAADAPQPRAPRAAAAVTPSYPVSDTSVGSATTFARKPRRRLILEPLEDDRRVVAAEAERIRHRDTDVRLAGLVRDVIEIALRVGVFVVDRRREDAL